VFRITTAMEVEGGAELRSRLDEINEWVKFLVAQKVEQLSTTQTADCRDPQHFRNLYTILIHCHLRRLLCLVEAMQDTWNSEKLFPCSILGRVAMEGAAIMVSINESLQKYISAKDYDRAYFWIASHVLATKRTDAPPKFSDLKLKSINIMDAIRAAEKSHKGFEDGYDWLSEFLHPNNFGVLSSFSEIVDVSNRKSVKFLDEQKVDKKAMANCLTGATLSISVFLMEWEKAKDIGQSIVATDWAATDQLEKLFSKSSANPR
jgi:hypothetical protein